MTDAAEPSEKHDTVKWLENARRLLDDARFLAGAGRLPTAYFLAVISAEEIGKVVLVELAKEFADIDLEKALRTHEPKQKAFGCLVLGDVFAELLTSNAKLIGAEDDSLQQVVRAFSAKYQNTFDAIDDPLIEEMMKGIASNQHQKLSSLALYGVWQDIKHMMIYSDAEKRFNVSNSDFDNIESACERAMKALGDVEQATALASAMKSLYDQPDFKDRISKAKQARRTV